MSKSYTTENEEYQDVTYGYDSSGNRISMNDRTGETLYTYDVLGRVTSVTDGSGQILTECGKQDGNLSEKYFTYDAQNQLSGYTEVYNGIRSETKYQYSDTGNRIAVTKGADSSAVVYEYDEMGRLIRETDSENGTIEYRYDANGNLINKISEDSTITYSYDVENRLNAVREGGELLMAASYDGDGNRVFQISRYTVTEII